MKIFLVLILLTYTLFALTLGEALKELEKNNLDIKISKQQSEVSFLSKEQKKYSQFGKLNFNTSYTKYNDDRTLAPITPPISNDITTSDEISSMGVTYKVTLFDGFSLKNDIEVLKLNGFISLQKEKLTYNQMIYNTQVLFTDILSLEALKKAYKQNHDFLFSLKKIVEKEFEYGKKAKIDIYKIQADIQKNSAKIIELKTNIKILKNSLALLIYSDNKDIEELQSITLKDKEQVYKFENLPQIKIAKNQEIKSDKNYNKALSSYYPKINFETSFSNMYGSDDRQSVSNISLQLSWNIFDFSVREKSIQKSKIEKLQAKLEFQKLQNEYKNEIEKAFETIKQNKSLLESAKAQFELASKTALIEELKYKENQISINDYLLAFSNKQFSQANKIQSNNNLLKSKFYYEYLIKE